MRYDRARVSLDRHATYIVAAYSLARPGNGQRRATRGAVPLDQTRIARGAV